MHNSAKESHTNAYYHILKSVTQEGKGRKFHKALFILSGRVLQCAVLGDAYSSRSGITKCLVVSAEFLFEREFKFLGSMVFYL